MYARYADGAMFRGTFKDGLREGPGHFRWPDGEVYEGDYRDDVRCGVGTYTWTDGRRYVGEFSNDERHGAGTLTCANGDVFEGVYEQGERAGPGALRYANGTVDRGVWSRNMLVRFEPLGGQDEKGASKSSNDGEGNTDSLRPGPLTVAGLAYLASVKAGDAVAVRVAMHGGVTFVDLVVEEGKSALYHAVTSGHTDVTRLLLSVGARPNHLTDKGRSILYDAYAMLPSVMTPPLHRGPIDFTTVGDYERRVRDCIAVLLDRFDISVLVLLVQSFLQTFLSVVRFKHSVSFAQTIVRLGVID